MRDVPMVEFPGVCQKKSNLTDCLSNLSSQCQKIGNYLFIMTKPDTLTV